MKLDQPDLSSLIQEFPEETRTKILNVVQDSHLKNSTKVRSWQSNMEASFKACYQVSVEVINGIAENLCVYRKLWGSKPVAAVHPLQQKLFKASKVSFPMELLKSTNSCAHSGQKERQLNSFFHYSQGAS